MGSFMKRKEPSGIKAPLKIIWATLWCKPLSDGVTASELSEEVEVVNVGKHDALCQFTFSPGL
jgi:hypothetical protein